MGLEEIRKLKEQAKLPKPPKTYRIPKVSPKKAAQVEKEREERGDGDSALDLWFEERRDELTGRCQLCGGRSEKGNDETHRRSIHHLLDKRKTMFPSLALNPVNFLEVCFYGNSCHQNIHGGKITWELLFDSAEWPIIKEKLKILLPLCTAEEKKNKIYSKLESLVYGKLG